MKFIKKYKSPNFNTRQKTIIPKYIILHYTAMNSSLQALKYLCDANNRVSSHFLISKSGKIYELVDIKYRAWHAGLSYWKKNKDINSNSIGIEIDNSGHHLLFEEYPDKQINELKKLIIFLKKNYHIEDFNILGHSDISPYRKIDPGEKLPWGKILNIKSENNLKFKNTKDNITNEINFKRKALFLLSEIGYDIARAKKNKENFILLIKAYQMHYRQGLVNGRLDLETFQIIQNHYNELLTF